MKVAAWVRSWPSVTSGADGGVVVTHVSFTVVGVEVEATLEDPDGT